ncbi:hypothetical protein GCM10010332_02030 [Streptomyces albogriseolus]|nr:hypothetical protein GCM10010332_02030 [Streptomyces albogriseolus]
MQLFGSMCSISVLPKARSSGVGWMQLTGQTDTQVASLQQVWVIAKAMVVRSAEGPGWGRLYVVR